MEIIDLRPAPDIGGGSSRLLARFDLKAGEHLHVNSIALRRKADGHYFIVAPNAVGKKSATFHPTLAKEITALAVERFRKIGGEQPDAYFSNY